jgi:hypothetical protein
MFIDKTIEMELIFTPESVEFEQRAMVKYNMLYAFYRPRRLAAAHNRFIPFI